MGSRAQDKAPLAARPVGFQHRAGCLPSGPPDSSGCRSDLVTGGEASARMLRHQASVLGPITCFVEWAVVLTHHQNPTMPVEFLKMQLNSYVHNVLQEVQVSHSTVIVALLYIHRFFGQKKHGDLCGPCLFVIALVTAYKYVEDLNKLMKEWVAASGLTSERMRVLEKNFLRDLKFCLAVNPEEFRLWKELYEREPLVGWWRGQTQSHVDQYQQLLDNQLVWLQQQPMSGGYGMLPALAVDSSLALPRNCAGPSMPANTVYPAYLSGRHEPAPVLYLAQPPAVAASFCAPRAPAPVQVTPLFSNYSLVGNTESSACGCRGSPGHSGTCQQLKVPHAQRDVGGDCGRWAIPLATNPTAKAAYGGMSTTQSFSRELEWLGSRLSAMVPYANAEHEGMANPNGDSVPIRRPPNGSLLMNMLPTDVEVEVVMPQYRPDAGRREARYQQGYDSETDEYGYGYPGHSYLAGGYPGSPPHDFVHGNQYSLFSHTVAPYDCFPFPWRAHATAARPQQPVQLPWEGLSYRLFQEMPGMVLLPTVRA